MWKRSFKQQFEGVSRKRVQLNRADRKKFYKKKKTENSATVKLCHWMTFWKKWISTSDGSDIKCEKCVCQSKKILQEKKAEKFGNGKTVSLDNFLGKVDTYLRWVREHSYMTSDVFRAFLTYLPTLIRYFRGHFYIT